MTPNIPLPESLADRLLARRSAGANLFEPRRGGFPVVEQSVVNAVRNYMRALHEHGLAVSFGVIFGSQSTGRAGQWSDIDLLVVSPRFDGPRGRQDVDLLWRLAARADSRIEPIPCGERQWQEDNSSPIVEIARREGERVTLPHLV